MLNNLLKPILERLPENNRLERIWIFAKVDFKKRYYDSGLGLFWALLNPLFQMTIYFFVFSYLFGSKIENFALYMFSALLCWLFFAEATKKGIHLLVQKRYLLESMPFKRKDLFIASTFGVFFGFLFNLLAYVMMSLILGVYFSWSIFFLPILVLNLFIISYAVALLLGTISIYFKDITHLWDIITLIGFWSVPIFWDQQILFNTEAIILLYLNPIAGIVVNLRNILLYGIFPDTFWLTYDIIFSLLFLIFAMVVFDKYSHAATEKL